MSLEYDTVLMWLLASSPFLLPRVLFPRWAPTAPCYLLVAKFSRLSEMLFRADTAVLCSDRPCLLVPLEKPSLLFQVQLDCIVSSEVSPAPGTNWSLILLYLRYTLDTEKILEPQTLYHT